MHIHSNSFEHRHTLAAEFALGAEHGNGFGGNCNPHLAWGDVPAGTQSFALLCTDTDAPTDGALVANAATPIPVAHPRGDFVHWVVANIPADVREIAAGSCSHGLTAKAPAGRRGLGALPVADRRRAAPHQEQEVGAHVERLRTGKLNDWTCWRKVHWL